MADPVVKDVDPKDRGERMYWMMTFNNYTGLDHMAVCQFARSHCKYAVVAKEVGEVEKTPHLQCFFACKTPQRMSALRGLFKKAHWQACVAGGLRCAEYCKKGEQPKEEWNEMKSLGPNFGKNASFEEFGTLPEFLKTRGKRARETANYDLAIEMALSNNINAIDSYTKLRFYRTFKEMAKDNPRQLENLPEGSVIGVFIHGVPGAGKSHRAREMCGTTKFYNKPNNNEWFDGYKDEKIVLIDDFSDPKLVVMLKTLCDRYPLFSNVKGNMVWMRPEQVIVTSNYSLEQLWPPNYDSNGQAQNVDYLAMKRRFVVHYMGEVYKPAPVIVSEPALEVIDITGDDDEDTTHDQAHVAVHVKEEPLYCYSEIDMDSFFESIDSADLE